MPCDTGQPRREKDATYSTTHMDRQKTELQCGSLYILEYGRNRAFPPGIHVAVGQGES